MPNYYAPPEQGQFPQQPYGIVPPRNHPPQGYYYPPRKKMSGKKVAALVVSIITFLLLSSAFGVFVLYHLGKESLATVFGECSTTPKVMASVIDHAKAQDYTLQALEYDCHRDETAQVTGDRAEVWLSSQAEYADSDSMLSDTKDVYETQGWIFRNITPLVATKDGYSLELTAHSYSPAMIRIDLSRDSVKKENSWDLVKTKSTYEEIKVETIQVNDYAILPDYTPSYMPSEYGTWHGYGLEDTYTLKGSQGKGYLPNIKISEGTDIHDSKTCQQYGPCLPHSILSNGLEIFTTQPNTVDRVQYIAVYEGKIITYQESLLFDPKRKGDHNVLPQEEVLKILSSINLSAKAPVKTD